MLCKVMNLTESGYYQSLKRKRSDRELQNLKLVSQIRIIHNETRGAYGSIRTHRELSEKGFSSGLNRVARLMRNNQIQARAAKKFKATTNSRHSEPIAPNLLQRQFQVEKPNRVWAGDVTYLWTTGGRAYLAVVLDLCSRKVVGWAVSSRNDARLVTLAFERAVALRRPKEGLIFHSDRGSTYASGGFREALARVHAVQSMSRKGNCWDNAVVESFFHSLKIERIAGERFTDRQELEYELFDYIERFYNRTRRHSTLGLISPNQFEVALAD